MRRFIIIGALGLATIFGSTAATQAAVVRRVTTTTKTVVTRQVVTEHVPGPAFVRIAGPRFVHVDRHFSHVDYRFHR